MSGVFSVDRYFVSVKRALPARRCASSPMRSFMPQPAAGTAAAIALAAASMHSTATNHRQRRLGLISTANRIAMCLLRVVVRPVVVKVEPIVRGHQRIVSEPVGVTLNPALQIGL